MAAEIEKARPAAAVEVHGESDQLGMFMVVANSDVVWNKYETGTFPKAAELIAGLPGGPTS